MAGEWEETILSELIEVGDAHLQTGPFGTALKAAEYSAEGVPLISVGEVRQGHFEISDKTPRVSVETTKRLRKFVLETGDIVFGRKGGIDRNAIVRPPQQGWFFGSDGIRLRLSKKHSSLFFSYQMRCPATRAWLLQNCEGTTMPSLNQEILGRVPIVLPPLAEQKAIAHILGTFDDKIELNRRMNETLEAMARAIFKSWFVDFDPVRAKAERRNPGLPKPIADLFPDSFEDSELGEMPKGWMVCSLPELFEINPTRSLSKGALAPYLDMSNMPTQGPSPTSWVMREMGSGTKFVNGDTLVARITPCLENGKTAFVDFLADGEVGWGSTEYIVLRPTGAIPPIFAYLLARTDDFRTFAIQHMTGSSGRQRVPADSLDKYRIASPRIDSPIFQHFSELVSPMFARIKAAIAQSRALIALRDTLLPTLLSGVIRPSEAISLSGETL